LAYEKIPFWLFIKKNKVTNSIDYHAWLLGKLWETLEDRGLDESKGDLELKFGSLERVWRLGRNENTVKTKSIRI